MTWVVAAQLCLLTLVCTALVRAESGTPPSNNLPFTGDYDLSCGTTGVGTYKPISGTDSGVQKIAQFAFQTWWQGNANETCLPGNAIQNGTKVTSACSQVVAGLNYAVLVEGFTVCPSNDTSDPTALMGTNVTIATKVYQPLGTAPPQITLLKLVDFSEEEL